ncbi:outer membrane beta-barrel protein, partial [Enterobacter hormaechei]|uniref:outer membrane beta-barrel protein n=1 Tax=Enterobacter hormaechei TaxID=158836 RepID=UPI00307672C7
THDEPCSMAPDDKHDLISGTCSHLPLTNDWDIYGRAGAMGYRAESDVSGHNRFETGVRPLAAVGTEYAFNKNWAGRLEYQWVSNVGNANQIGVSSDLSSVTAGLSYRFGQYD